MQKDEAERIVSLPKQQEDLIRWQRQVTEEAERLVELQRQKQEQARKEYYEQARHDPEQARNDNEQERKKFEQDLKANEQLRGELEAALIKAIAIQKQVDLQIQYYERAAEAAAASELLSEAAVAKANA